MNIYVYAQKKEWRLLFSLQKEENPAICHKALDCVPQFIVFRGI